MVTLRLFPLGQGRAGSWAGQVPGQGRFLGRAGSWAGDERSIQPEAGSANGCSGAATSTWRTLTHAPVASTDRSDVRGSIVRPTGGTMWWWHLIGRLWIPSRRRWRVLAPPEPTSCGRTLSVPGSSRPPATCRGLPTTKTTVGTGPTACRRRPTRPTSLQRQHPFGRMSVAARGDYGSEGAIVTVCIPSLLPRISRMHSVDILSS
jgi:hypothetical protein